MPAVLASASAGLRASALLGLNTIASTPCEIRSRRSLSWPAESVLWAIITTFDTCPEASASALAVQFCSSRKPLPVPPVFEKPITYCLAACVGEVVPPPPLVAAGPAELPGDVHAAAARATTAAIVASRRAIPVCFTEPPPYLSEPPRSAESRPAHPIVASDGAGANLLSTRIRSPRPSPRSPASGGDPLCGRGSPR